MEKLNYEDKINLYEDRLSIKSFRTKHTQYLCYFINKHELDIVTMLQNKKIQVILSKKQHGLFHSFI